MKAIAAKEFSAGRNAKMQFSRAFLEPNRIAKGYL
jgi:hypothetical protein